MRINKKLFKLTAGASLMVVAGGAYADTETNTMTNIVTVVAACDVVATGVDFGITTMPIPSIGIPSVLANTATGNAVTGNAGHPGAGRDGGADDTFELVTVSDEVNTVINTLIASIGDVGLPGVYVVCTTTPTAITLSSGANSLALPTALSAFSGSFSSKMNGVGGGASGSNAIDYALLMVGTPTSTPATGLPVGVFAAAFAAVGLIPGAQGSNNIVPGYYSDTATVQVDF